MQIKTRWVILSALVYGLLQGIVLISLSNFWISLFGAGNPINSLVLPAIIPLIIGIVIFIKNESSMNKRILNGVLFLILGYVGFWIDLLIYVSIFGI
jgi:hypothetical protein|tara:strand:- start:66 stop:356 length:291 start_codon:yes stop_codon:yes gene_type:complete